MEHIIEEFVFFVPQVDALICNGSSDIKKVLKEFCCQALVGGIFFRQLQRHSHHVECEHRHPTCSIRLFDIATRWKLGTAVKYSNVIHPKKASLENIIS